jgi:ATP/maltotriose-dependent transcriptional regulator MalT
VAYRHAHRLGRDPQPGLALLRLAQGRAATAAASLRTALTAVLHDRLARARLCAAQVEITLAAGEPEEARRACDELERTASTYGSSGLEASALQARGAVLLEDRRPEAALPTLRAACRRWQELDVPYDAARVRLLLARAYRALGDGDAAGRTNREIAGTLVLSHKTVARHLSNIFAKIGVTSRTQAAAYAYEHGLATPERG